MNIQGTFNTKVQLDGKMYGIFTNKNKSIVDIREIIGTKDKAPIFAETRPKPFIKDQNSIHPTVVDYYHTFYGRNI